MYIYTVEQKYLFFNSTAQPDVLYKNNNEEIFQKFENNGNSLRTTDIKIVLKDKNTNI
jgi:hypothetical protein